MWVKQEPAHDLEKKVVLVFLFSKFCSYRPENLITSGSLRYERNSKLHDICQLILQSGATARRC